MQPNAVPLVRDDFAAAGGWDQGLRLAGYRGRVVGVEWDATACRTAEAAGHERVCADVTQVEPLALSPLDGYLASPPCQSWSTTGKRLGYDDPRGKLIDQPRRVIREALPRWFACEQVDTDDVMWHWRALAHEARNLGYKVWYGYLESQWYGVAQTRRRAIVMGRRDGLPVSPPEGDRTRVVSMVDALGWGGAVQRSNYSNGGKKGERGYRPMTGPAFTVTSKCTSNLWEWPDGVRRNWTVAEAGVIQSFPVDYPWQGSPGEQKLQVGNAIPPLMAAAIVTPMLSSAPVSASVELSLLSV